MHRMMGITEVISCPRHLMVLVLNGSDYAVVVIVVVPVVVVVLLDEFGECRLGVDSDRFLPHSSPIQS